MDEVKPMFVIENPALEDGTPIRQHEGGNLIEIQNPDGTWSGPYYLPNDFVIKGTKRTITLQDIIALEGERNPSSSQSQKDFKTAFILLTNEEEKAVDESGFLQKLASFKDGFLRFFKEMARNLGSLSLPSLNGVQSLESAASSGAASTVGVGAQSSRQHFIERMNRKFEEDHHDLISPENAKIVPGAFDLPLATVAETFTSGPLDAGLSVGMSLPAAFQSQQIASAIPSLQSNTLIPVNLDRVLPVERQNLIPASIQKPVLYTELREQPTVAATDPFALDPVLSSPIPLLVSAETLPLIRTELRSAQEQTFEPIEEKGISTSLSSAPSVQPIFASSSPTLRHMEPRSMSPLSWNGYIPWRETGYDRAEKSKVISPSMNIRRKKSTKRFQVLKN